MRSWNDGWRRSRSSAFRPSPSTDSPTATSPPPTEARPPPGSAGAGSTTRCPTPGTTCRRKRPRHLPMPSSRSSGQGVPVGTNRRGQTTSRSYAQRDTLPHSAYVLEDVRPVTLAVDAVGPAARSVRRSGSCLAALVASARGGIMRSSRFPRRLLGRRNECRTIDDFLAGVREGRSAALVVHGEAGIGKSALLEYALQSASDFQIAGAAGVESEMELAFGGLHQLCAPFLDRLDRLPGPQRDALRTVFGLDTAPPPDRFLVGLAVLSLLADIAEERPLVCIIDDAQWLDQVSAETLAFVARRLLVEPVALLFALRDIAAGQSLKVLPQLEVAGLNNHDAGALLDSATPGPLDERIRDRILAEPRGNPLGLLELPRNLTAAEMAGGFLQPAPRPLTGRIEQGFLRRVRSSP